MKQSKASKTLLAIVTILTVMMALIVPSPAYAAKEPPPPPPPPSNDTGGKISGPSHSSAKDIPSDTSVVVTDNGTPVSLAAQLATDIFSSATPPPTNPVKFCVAATSVCKTYTDVENALKDIKAAPDATGILYVASNYSLSGSNLAHQGILTIDPTSSGWVDTTMNLAMQGGVNIVTNAPLGTSLLKQPLTINGINEDSSFTLDSFVFNIGTRLLPTNAISVTNSNNITLKNLTVTDSNYGGAGIFVNNSNNVTIGGDVTAPNLYNVTVTRSAGLSGDGIHIEGSGDVTLTNVNTTNTSPGTLGLLPVNGLSVSGSENISMDNVTATSTKMYGAYLNGNSDGLTISNSTFSNSGYAGLYVTKQTGQVNLTNVTADNNGKNVPDTTLTPFKFLFPDLASGAAFMDNSGALIINGGEFNNNATAGLWVQNQTGAPAPLDAQAELDGDTAFIMVNGVTANGNGVSPCTSCYPVLGDIFDRLGWTGGSFIDADAGSVVVKDSNFSGNTGDGLEAYATNGDLIVKNVTADGNTGDGATLNTYVDLNDIIDAVDLSNLTNLTNLSNPTGGFAFGSGKIIVTGDEPSGDDFSSEFNGNNGTGLDMYSGGFAGVFNTEVASNYNLSNDSLLDIAAGTAGLPGLEALLLNPGGAFIFSNSPDSVVVGNSWFTGNNGEGLAVMTPGDIRVHDVYSIGNDGMGAFLDNCLVLTGLQCTGNGSISVSDSWFNSNSYAGLVALASGAAVEPEDTNSFSQGIYLDNVEGTGNANYGALLVSPADVEVTNSSFDGAVPGPVIGDVTFQQATGLAVLSGGNVFLESYETLFGNDNPGLTTEDYGVEASGNTGAGAVVLGLGSLGGLGTGSLFDGALASDAVTVNGIAMVTDSSFTGNGGDGLTALATEGIGVGDSIFAGNGGNGLTALSLGDIYLIESGFFKNGGNGAFATSLLGNVVVDPSIFAGNVGNGLTAIAVAGDVSLQDSGFYGNGGDGALATAVLGGVSVEDSRFAGNVGNGLTALSLDNIYIGDSGFFKNGGDGAFTAALLGNIGVDDSVFARNDGNGLTALTTGGILLGDSGFFRNGGDGAFTTSVDSTAVVDNTFAGNHGNGLTALSLSDVILGDSGFYKNGGDGAFVAAALGGVAVDNSVFARNNGNGLTALSLNDIFVGDSGFFGNGGDGAFTTSFLGGTTVLESDFAGNGENGLTALSLGDIFLAGDFAGSNDDNGAVLVSGLGDISVVESVFGTPIEGATSGGPTNYGNGDNGLVATTLAGDVILGDVDATQNGDNGIVATSLLGDIEAESVYADQNGVIGALLTSVTGEVGVEDSGFDNNGGVGLVGLGAQDVFLGWSEASGNQYAGATLASLGDVVVTNSEFLGESDYYAPAYAPQMLGLGVVGGDVVLDSSGNLPGSTSVDAEDFGVNASGNGVMGALVLSASDIQIGDSVFDENGGSVANLGVLSLLGNGVVAVGGLDGNGGNTWMFNTEANGNTSFGAVLFNTDLVGAYDGSAFDSNGVGGLLGVSLGDLELDNIEANGNSFIGAATLSGGYTSVSNSSFDSNLGGAGLLSVAFGPIWAENVDASSNGILGAGLVSLDTSELTAASADGPCADIGYNGDICVNQMTANNNGFIGAAILGTDWVEVDNSQFTGNDSLGSLAGVIPGGGLVVIGGESTVLDQVTANENLGFGAVVGNTGGVYDLLTSLIGSSNDAAGAISQSVTGSAMTLDLGDLPIFTDTGNISITNSSFSNNDAFGLLAVSNGDIYMAKDAANNNGTFGASLSAEGNITVKHSTFNGNGTYGLEATIFSPAEAGSAGNTSHTVFLNSVDASHNGDFGAMVQANTTDNVDVTVTFSSFEHNQGADTGGLGIFTTGDVLLNTVVSDYNAGDGADISGNNVTIQNSHFNYNQGYGLVIDSLAKTSLEFTNVCYNALGPDILPASNVFKDHYVTNCQPVGGGTGPVVEANPAPWQIINVMMDPGTNSGTLSCLFGTTFLYLEKMTPPTPDFEWARAVLSACIVPGGSTAKFLGLAEGALPGALPDGITFQGKAFDLSIVGPNGQPIVSLGGPMMVRFTLPDGFTLPSGKKLDILWWDPAGKKWVELNTNAGGQYAWCFAGNDGTFVLAIK